MEDEDAVERAKRGDVEAFATLVERHQYDLFRTACLLTGDVDLAKDVVQEALLKGFRSMRSLREARYVRAWLLRIVTRETHNTRLQNRRRDAREAGYETPNVRCALGPEDIMLRTESQAEILAAVRRLPSDSQAVVVMRYFLELTESEMAMAIGRPAGTVKSRLSRALIQLRSELSQPAVERVLEALSD